jgi:TRAP-type mannitol/chloroaromatic compound transport system permease small subunit
MSKVNSIISSISNVNEKIGFATSLLFIPITLITVFEVIMRYIFNSPTIWAWDLNMQLFAPLVMMSGGYVFLYGSHVIVDVFTIKLSPRTRAILDICTSVIFFLAIIVLIWKGTQFGIRSFMRGETMSSIWGPPFWTIKLWVPIGAFFVLIQGIAKLLKDFQIVFPRQSAEIVERSEK